MDVLIRLAQLTDYEAVMGIRAQVQELHANLRPDLYRSHAAPMSRERYEELVCSGNLYVAQVDGRIAGIMEILYRHDDYPVVVPRDVIYIDTLAVDEKYRRRGIGRALLEKAKELKREKGAHAIELQVNARNAAAISMYESFGFTCKSMKLELLDD